MLFFISFFMVFISSYLFASVLSPKDENNYPKSIYPFLFTLLIMFAQIVLTMECLSLFSAIKENTVLGVNLLFLIMSTLLWFKNGRPLYIPKFKETIGKIVKGLKKDNFLKIMAFGFVFFIITVILLDIFMPVGGGDALTYHLNRSSYWLFQGDLSHFTISDDRNLVMPINSEIIYLWNLLFFKNDVGLFFVSFIGYLGVIFSIYNILELFGFSERRKLWAIFILSSFASVMAEVSSLETDVLIAGLVLASITLFLYAIKDNNRIGIFFSALAYALAMGTKTPAIIVFPGVFLMLSYFAYQKYSKAFYRPLVLFLAFLFVNFMIFSSYNYILNFLDFGDFLGTESSKAIHGFRGGFKAYIANYIRYIFMMFDFSGFRYSEYVGEHIINAKLAIFDFLKIPHELGVEMSDNNEINNRFINVKVGTGLLGFLLFLPSVVTATILGFFKKCGRKIHSLFAFGCTFFVNIACLSGAIAYMVYSVRFMTFIILISCPVLALSYFKKANILKYFILFFVMSYFLVMSVNLAGRKVTHVFNVFMTQPTLTDAREHLRCSIYTGFEGKKAFCYIRENILTLPKGTKIGMFTSANSSNYSLNMLNAYGYVIDTLLPELAPTYDLSKYDYILTTNKAITSSVLVNDTKNIKTLYKIAPNGNAFYPEYRPFSCVYQNQIREFYHSDKKNGIVVASVCYMDHNFFLSKGFERIRIVDFQSELQEYAMLLTIYKNKNLH